MSHRAHYRRACTHKSAKYIARSSADVCFQFVSGQLVRQPPRAGFDPKPTGMSAKKAALLKRPVWEESH
jgi:hypothetical protein